jgi:hypothetical protein
MTDVYREYISENDPDGDNVLGVMDNCPLVANADQADADADGTGDGCDVENSEEKTDPSASLGTGSTTTGGTATTSEEAVVEVIDLNNQ